MREQSCGGQRRRSEDEGQQTKDVKHSNVEEYRGEGRRSGNHEKCMWRLLIVDE